MQVNTVSMLNFIPFNLYQYKQLELKPNIEL